MGPRQSARPGGEAPGRDAASRSSFLPTSLARFSAEGSSRDSSSVPDRTWRSMRSASGSSEILPSLSSSHARSVPRRRPASGTRGGCAHPSGPVPPVADRRRQRAAGGERRGGAPRRPPMLVHGLPETVPSLPARYPNLGPGSRSVEPTGGECPGGPTRALVVPCRESRVWSRTALDAPRSRNRTLCSSRGVARAGRGSGSPPHDAGRGRAGRRRCAGRLRVHRARRTRFPPPGPGCRRSVPRPRGRAVVPRRPAAGRPVPGRPRRRQRARTATPPFRNTSGAGEHQPLPIVVEDGPWSGCGRGRRGCGVRRRRPVALPVHADCCATRCGPERFPELSRACRPAPGRLGDGRLVQRGAVRRCRSRRSWVAWRWATATASSPSSRACRARTPPARRRGGPCGSWSTAPIRNRRRPRRGHPGFRWPGRAG